MVSAERMPPPDSAIILTPKTVHARILGILAIFKQMPGQEVFEQLI